MLMYGEQRLSLGYIDVLQKTPSMSKRVTGSEGHNDLKDWTDLV